MHHVMEKYFLSSTTNSEFHVSYQMNNNSITNNNNVVYVVESSLSILLSEFSHLEVWHLGINMLVLWSFAPALLSKTPYVVREVYL